MNFRKNVCILFPFIKGKTVEYRNLLLTQGRGGDTVGVRGHAVGLAVMANVLGTHAA